MRQIARDALHVPCARPRTVSLFTTGDDEIANFVSRRSSRRSATAFRQRSTLPGKIIRRFVVFKPGPAAVHPPKAAPEEKPTRERVNICLLSRTVSGAIRHCPIRPEPTVPDSSARQSSSDRSRVDSGHGFARRIAPTHRQCIVKFPYSCHVRRALHGRGRQHPGRRALGTPHE